MSQSRKMRIEANFRYLDMTGVLTPTAMAAHSKFIALASPPPIYKTKLGGSLSYFPLPQSLSHL